MIVFHNEFASRILVKPCPAGTEVRGGCLSELLTKGIERLEIAGEELEEFWSVGGWSVGGQAIPKKAVIKVLCREVEHFLVSNARAANHLLKTLVHKLRSENGVI